MSGNEKRRRELGFVLSSLFPKLPPQHQKCKNHLDIFLGVVYNDSEDRQHRVSIKALKHSRVPVSLVMLSFREGLCNETSSRSRRKPKENAQGRLVNTRRLFFYIVRVEKWINYNKYRGKGSPIRPAYAHTKNEHERVYVRGT
ncbi:MAG: hypothetical protein RSC08_03785, partial [Oscillospiraceae bacterium]